MTSARASPVKASVYVPRLRRAFLLQVHPDRFRSQSESVRKQQARLVQALSDRMTEHDFLAYTASSSKLSSPVHTSYSQGEKTPAYDSYPFSIEKRDGTISRESIQLDNSSPYQILGRMAESINFPLPPPPPPQFSEITFDAHNERGELNQPIFHQNGAMTMRNGVDQFIFSHGWGSHRHKTPGSTERDILHFLKNMDFDDIKQRKLDRINATAAALVARRAFKFSAVDGTGLGWSSASLSMLLSRLTSLHEEHQNFFHTGSFYPFRLLISSDEFQKKVDLFGGIIRLNPAATSLQWLGTLLSVSDESVASFKKNRIELKKNLSIVENALGLKAVKGHTCPPGEYHRCVERLATESHHHGTHEDEQSLVAAVSKATLVIESSQTCRRGRLRKDGNFEVGAGMDLNGIRKTIAEFAIKSNRHKQTESEKQERCKELVRQVMYEFGVQRVNRVGPIVESDQMLDCLSFLLNKDESEKDEIRGYLTGQSIGIAGRGQLCHLGDDGSIIIPT
eukprot:CAMPEP_0181092376 /NCGR_PEP_ID=MMETSP1071-20121207/8887_1 /TAXON_ID=35127 /ORGANISM="Thalassiosira sp., Strain NH16" /LENGTH=507 /DNA_ID=CAMNT_0023174555 /DNA_START=7 /DNA_END=1526 /DNA_ORIENTATION=+